MVSSPKGPALPLISAAIKGDEAVVKSIVTRDPASIDHAQDGQVRGGEAPATACDLVHTAFLK